MKIYSYLLFAAIDRGDASEVENLLDSGYCSPFDRNLVGTSAVAYLKVSHDHRCHSDRSKQARVKMIETMLLKDADLDLLHAKCDIGGKYHVKHPLVEYLKLLSEDGSPLVKGALKDFVDKVVLSLLHCDACVNAQDNEGLTPLMINTLYYKELLDHGADMHTRDHRGYTALMHAVERVAVPKVEYLIEHGACVDVVSHDSHTPFSIVFDKLFSERRNVKLYGHTIQETATDNFSIIWKLLEQGDVGIMSKKNQADFVEMLSLGWDDLVQIMILGGFPPLPLPRDKLVEYGTQLLESWDDYGEYMLYSLERYQPPVMFVLQIYGFDTMLSTGYVPQLVSSLEEHESQFVSPLQIALYSFNSNAARFLLANRFLTPNDVTHLSKDQNIQSILNMTDNNWVGDATRMSPVYDYSRNLFTVNPTPPDLAQETRKIILAIIQSPLSLFTLCHVTLSSVLLAGREVCTEVDQEESGGVIEENVSADLAYDNSPTLRGKKRGKSSCLGRSAQKRSRRSTSSTSSKEDVVCLSMRSYCQKVHSLPLPMSIKQSLLFQTPNASLCPTQWNTLSIDNL